MRTRASRTLAAVLAALMLAACADGDEPGPIGICAAVVTPAVRVVVTDSVTREPLSQRARGWAIRGNAADSLRVAATGADGRPLEYVAYGEAGEYTVVVNAQGYAPWAVSGVRVPAVTCGVETARLDAPLQPVHTTF